LETALDIRYKIKIPPALGRLGLRKGHGRY